MNKYVVALLLGFSTNAASGGYLSIVGCNGPEGYPWDFDHDELSEAIVEDIKASDFKSLIDAASSWEKQGCLLKSGEPRINYWLSGFSRSFSRLGWGNSLEKIEKFKAVYPDSPLPLLAEARYWSDYANNARGSGYARTVTPEGWRLFKERLEKSESLMESIHSSAKDWPQWYWQMIRVQSLLQRPQETINQTFLEGVKNHPNALPIYTEMAYFLEPKWGGSWSAVDKIAALATQHISRESPNVTYTRVYWATGGLSSPQALLSDTKVSWTKMRQGFIELLNLYPDSSYIGNNFLVYACTANDKPIYRKYRQLVKKFDDRVWALDDRNSCDSTMGFGREKKATH